MDVDGILRGMGTPLPLPQAKGLVQCGARKLEHLDERDGRVRLKPLVTDDLTRQVVVAHAEALMPSFADPALCVAVAWQNLHTYWLHPIVGQAHNRNTKVATDALADAWTAHGAGADNVPMGVVLPAQGTPGVLLATSAQGCAPQATLDDPWTPDGLVFCPADGGPVVPLDTVDGLEQFFARVPLAITPSTLAWILHLVRLPFATQEITLHEPGLFDAWRVLEEKPPLGAAAALLGVKEGPPAVRQQLALTVGDHAVRYEPGELTVTR